jgi:formate hydrogenlyase subunit 3/multisubunit Na+/H+ antiporter MnhD subunit
MTNLNAIALDISKSCITIAGFVLTILTIVISFKNSTDSKNESDVNQSESTNKSKIKLFFSSDLYYKTVSVLQQSITGLVFIFVLFMSIVLFDKSLSQNIKFYTIIFGLTIATLIFLRCILTLKLIIRLQMSNDKDKNHITE